MAAFSAEISRSALFRKNVHEGSFFKKKRGNLVQVLARLLTAPILFLNAPLLLFTNFLEKKKGFVKILGVVLGLAPKTIVLIARLPIYVVLSLALIVPGTLLNWIFSGAQALRGKSSPKERTYRKLSNIRSFFNIPDRRFFLETHSIDKICHYPLRYLQHRWKNRKTEVNLNKIGPLVQQELEAQKNQISMLLAKSQGLTYPVDMQEIGALYLEKQKQFDTCVTDLSDIMADIPCHFLHDYNHSFIQMPVLDGITVETATKANKGQASIDIRDVFINHFKGLMFKLLKDGTTAIVNKTVFKQVLKSLRKAEIKEECCAFKPFNQQQIAKILKKYNTLIEQRLLPAETLPPPLVVSIAVEKSDTMSAEAVRLTPSPASSA